MAAALNNKRRELIVINGNASPAGAAFLALWQIARTEFITVITQVRGIFTSLPYKDSQSGHLRKQPQIVSFSI